LKSPNEEKIKLWGGRFTSGTASSVEAFTASIDVDARLYRHDIAGSIAHARMLARQRIISARDARKIVRGLKAIEREIESGKFAFSPNDEDIHMNIERRLTEKIGAAGGKLHTARSRNDQVALDTRLFLREEVRLIVQSLQSLGRELARAARRHLDVIMPGYTHLQRAQPVLFAHHLLAYFEMFERDRERFASCLERINVLPLGAGALAGTTFPIDRNYVAKLLDFPRVAKNSIDAVSDRDFILEFLSASAILFVHLSRLAEELILWSSHEFGFVELPDRYCTGSSMMPQKKNPDVPELIRGKSGRVFGHLHALLTTMKGLPLAYNRDLQEDKTPLFDAVATVGICLEAMAGALATAKFRADRMRAALDAGFLTATEVADWLSARGIPFREAHELTGKLVREAMNRGITLQQLPLEALRSFHPAFDASVYDVLDAEVAVERRTGFGAPSAAQVEKAIASARARLKSTPD